MPKRVLITGGAGFIGSHLADHLIERGYRVRVLDSLLAQVHDGAADGDGDGGRSANGRPDYLSSIAELQVGDVRDARAVRKALDGVDAVFHFAARVGVGQSMYEIAEYTDVNNRGTAVLLEALIEQPVDRLVVASSMSVYGEGQYVDPDGRPVAPPERPLERLRRREWTIVDEGGRLLAPVPTPETKTPAPSSVYALSKYDQERLSLLVGEAYGISTVALRFFNVYGSRQALSNPYTGVLAIFAARYLNGQPPIVFEDGEQRRDFVSVLDVVQACRLALESPRAAGQVFNVGSGTNASVREIAERMAAVLGRPEIRPKITGKVRVGDIRHCFADIKRAREVLGYRPRVTLEEGLDALAGWLSGRAAVDRVETAGAELTRRGLAV